MYLVYIDDMLFPVAPSKIETKISNRNETIDLAVESEVNIIKAAGLTELSMDLRLPNRVYPFAVYPDGKYKAAKEYLDKLEALKTGRKSFTLIIMRNIGNDTGSTFNTGNTSMQVTIEDYTVKEDAEEGIDFTVDINFKQYQPFGTKKVVFKKKSSGKATKKTKEKKRAKSTKKSGGTYTVKSGDCLTNIAKKKLGKASRWTEIYKLNKTTIENAAKKHGRKSSSNGHWIYPGTKLKLPER